MSQETNSTSSRNKLSIKNEKYVEAIKHLVYNQAEFQTYSWIQR